jgi:uracil-DNA glycosylase
MSVSSKTREQSRFFCARIDNMKKFATLQNLHNHFHTVNTCNLKTDANPVFGDGNPRSCIIFIGEAPGKKEDQTGKPFMGAAGKFLNEMLASIKLNREDIYITNIVKYRPPNNRDPKPDEKESCADWLQSEIEYIKPKLIVFLGRHAMHHFFPNLIISEAHGKMITESIPGFSCNHFLPLYHPAAALYNGGMREQLLKDFKRIPKILKKLEK